MLISTRPLFKPNPSEHLAQIRGGGGERHSHQCTFEGVKYQNVGNLIVFSEKGMN